MVIPNETINWHYPRTDMAKSYLDSRARLGFPMAPKAWADEVLAQIEKKAAA